MQMYLLYNISLYNNNKIVIYHMNNEYRAVLRVWPCGQTQNVYYNLFIRWYLLHNVIEPTIKLHRAPHLNQDVPYLFLTSTQITQPTNGIILWTICMKFESSIKRQFCRSWWSSKFEFGHETIKVNRVKCLGKMVNYQNVQNNEKRHGMTWPFLSRYKHEIRNAWKLQLYRSWRSLHFEFRSQTWHNKGSLC